MRTDGMGAGGAAGGLALLGPVRAHRGEVPLDLGPVRRQAVLAALVLRTEALVTHQQLLDDVWGLEPPGTGRRVLPSYVYPLRKALDAPGTGPADSVIRGERGGYRFVLDEVRTDIGELARRSAVARGAGAAGDLTAALDSCTRALDLFRGEPLAGLPGPLAEAERRRLVRQWRTLHQERAECLLLLGRYAEALDGLLAAPAAQPHDEPLAALRMRALYGSGRQAEALVVFQETRDRLRGELGVEPGEELCRVHQGVLRRDDLLLLGRASPRATGPTTAQAPPAGAAAPAPASAPTPPPASESSPPAASSPRAAGPTAVQAPSTVAAAPAPASESSPPAASSPRATGPAAAQAPPAVAAAPAPASAPTPPPASESSPSVPSSPRAAGPTAAQAPPAVAAAPPPASESSPSVPSPPRAAGPTAAQAPPGTAAAQAPPGTAPAPAPESSLSTPAAPSSPRPTAPTAAQTPPSTAPAPTPLS
uniref:AfsR/SARP family transcriptional regulator n=1 Tax=Streptomyces sp. NRRL S-920 TaxID=1463921 RepID=UPI001F380FE0